MTKKKEESDFQKIGKRIRYLSLRSSTTLCQVSAQTGVLAVIFHRNSFATFTANNDFILSLLLTIMCAVCSMVQTKRKAALIAVKRKEINLFAVRFGAMCTKGRKFRRHLKNRMKVRVREEAAGEWKWIFLPQERLPDSKKCVCATLIFWSIFTSNSLSFPL